MKMKTFMKTIQRFHETIFTKVSVNNNESFHIYTMRLLYDAS